MTDIQIPSKIEELLQAESGFQVVSEWNPSDLTDDEITGHFEDMVGLTSSEGGLDELSQDTVDALYSLVTNFTALADDHKELFVEALTELAAASVGSVVEQMAPAARNARKQLVFFVVEFIRSNEQLERDEAADAGDRPKKTGKAAKDTGAAANGRGKKSAAAESSFSWVDWRHTCLKIVHDALCTEPSHLWSMGVVQENYLFGMWSSALALLDEKPAGVAGVGHVESAVRGLCVAIVTRCAALFGRSSTSGAMSALSTALLNAIVRSEHMCNFAAEICSRARATTLPAELLHDISGMQLTATSSGVKNIGLYLEALARVNPHLMTQHFASLKEQIDSPAHQIRSSLLQAMGLVVAYIHRECEALGSAGEGKGKAAQQAQDGDVEGAAAGEGEVKDLSDDADGEEKGDNEEDEEDAEEEARGSGAGTNVAQLTRIRDAFLDLLIERTHDVSPWTRTNVLKVWVQLLEGHSVPVRSINRVAELAVDRLNDKAVTVRKSALALLTCVLDNNPFAGNLGEASYVTRRAELEQAFADRVQELRENAAPEIGDEYDEEEEESGEGEGKEGGSEEAAALASARAEAFLESEDVRQDAEACALRAQLDYVCSVQDFVTTVQGAVAQVAVLVRSKTVSDVVEAVRFFVRAVNFNVKGAKKHLQGCFSLVFHQEKAVVEECLQAFKHAYLTDGAANAAEARALSPEEVACNLIHVCEMCDAAEAASLEEIVGALFLQDEVDRGVVGALWAIVARHAAPGAAWVTELSLAGALNVLAMVAKLQPDVVSATKVRLVGDAALRPALAGMKQAAGAAGAGARPFTDATAAKTHLGVLRAACRLLQATKGSGLHTVLARVRAAAAGIAVAPLEGSVEALEGVEHAHLHQALLDVAPALRDVLLGAFLVDGEGAAGQEPTKHWFAACEEAMHALFHAHPCPDRVLASVVAPLFAALSGTVTSLQQSSPDLDTDGSEASASASGAGAEKVYCAASRLARLLFVLGQGALCSLVYTEKLADVAKKFSDRQPKDKDTEAGIAAVAASAAAGSGSAAGKGGRGKGKQADSDAANAAAGGADAMEEEMGMAAAADADHERLFHLVTERQLVFDNLLGRFHPLIAYVVANEKGQFADPVVRETALLALCRYMSVSGDLCEKYLPLLFTALEKEPVAANRTTVVIALGDLAFRFPNALEPWTARMYARLSDDATSVRYNTLMVLTHLILNDMVKVKGQVSHVVMCLADSCEAVRDLAQLFFVKLSERSNNPIYNLLGDIIGTLSRDRRATPATASSAPTSSSSSDQSTDESSTTAPASSSAGAAGRSKVHSALSASVEADDDAVGVVAVAAVDVDESTLPQRLLSSREFQTVMRFLLGFVKKDKQADGLLERLLVRLGLAQTAHQRRNLAYCIAELPVSIKGLKKMVELFKHVRGALHDKEVLEFVSAAVAKAKKPTAKGAAAGAAAAQGDEVAGAAETAPVPAVGAGEVKAVVDELEGLLRALGGGKGASAALERAGGEGVEGEEGEGEEHDEEKAPVVAAAAKTARGGRKAAATPAKGKAKAKGRSRRGRKDESSDEEEEEEEEEEEDENEAPTKESVRSASNRPAASAARGKGAATATATGPTKSSRSKSRAAAVEEAEEAEAEF